MAVQHNTEAKQQTPYAWCGRPSLVPIQGGGGEEKHFWCRVGYFFSGVTPPRGGGLRKKWVLRKKLFLPMSHVPHIITVFPPHNMPVLLVGIPLCGYFGY